MTLMSVDLPAPFSPTSACTWPGCRSMDTSSRARTPPKRLLMPSTSRTGVPTSEAGAVDVVNCNLALAIQAWLRRPPFEGDGRRHVASDLGRPSGWTTDRADPL